MYWDYRLAHKKVGDDTLYGIVECYYNDNAEITFTTANFVSPNDYETPEDVIKSLKAMLSDCTTQEILDLDNIEYPEA